MIIMGFKLDWFAIADWFLLLIFASPILGRILGIITIYMWRVR